MQGRRVSASNGLPAALTVLAVLLAACGDQPLLGSYEPGTAACCGSVAEVSFTPVVPGQDTPYTLKAGGSVLLLDGRRQHFIALALSEGFQLTAIQVRSPIALDMVTNETAVYPDIVFLDADRNRIARVSPEAPALVSNPVVGVTVTSRIIPPRNARYLIVLAGDSKLRDVLFGTSLPKVGRAAALGDFSLRLFGESVH